MSSRTKKTTTTTTVSSTATPGPSTPPSSSSSFTSPRSGSGRPPSPTMISRIQEKRELAGLNDRLATYIDKVRSLESENKALTTQVRTHEETTTQQITNMKSMYDTELKDARKLLDDTSKEKAKLQIDVNKYKQEMEDWKDKFQKKDKEYNALEKQFLAADAQANELQARLQDAVNQRKHFENEYNKLKAEFDKLQKQLIAVRKQLETETVSRVDLENRLQSLKEELAFKTQVHEQELNETRTRTEITMEEVDGQLQREYEGKLKEALQQMREENDYQIRITREEVETVFQKKLEDLRHLAERNDNIAQSARDELTTLRKRSSELASQNTKLTSQVATLEARVRDLESQLIREQDEHAAAIDARDIEIRRLRAAIEEQMNEYRDLMDIKIALDMEIAAYRRLLESEESRLNISSATEATPGRSTPRRTPMRVVGASGRKRKRMEEAGLGGSMFSQSSDDRAFTESRSGKGVVTVQETNSEGKYIKLKNSTDKDVSLGGWTLKHKAGEEETTYKFHRSTTLKPGAVCTVYSSTTDVTHQPPSELVMKGMSWYTGDEMVTTLADNKGEDQAELKMTKNVAVSSIRSFRSTRDELDSGIEGDPNRDDKCIVM